jgi:hypothetical protein
MQVDEYVLAGYISGSLSEAERKNVSAELIRNKHLREWLHMACSALAATGDEKQEGPNMRLLDTMEPARPGIRRGDRSSAPSVARVRAAI